jgi:hypothetical protein
MKNHKAGESLKDRPKAGQPVVMTKILKIMVTKSLTQKSSQQESLSIHLLQKVTKFQRTLSTDIWLTKIGA